MRKMWSFVSSRNGRSVVAVVMVLAATVAAVNLDRRTEGERAKAWAESHASSLPTSLAALAAFPQDYRKAIVAALPAADKSRLWREQLQFLLDHETLNNEQRTFIEKTMALATPRSFEPNQPRPEVCADIALLFVDPDQRARIIDLGAVATPALGAWSTITQVNETIHRAVGLNARRLICNCRGFGFCECGLTQACVGAGTCESSQNCGCIWAGPCDSYCETPIINNLKVK